MKNHLTTLLLSATALLFSPSCVQQQHNGEALAKKHCSACHTFVTPSLLDKSTWKSGVLPEMAFRMGLDISKLPGTNAAELNEILKALPPGPLVTKEEWKAIEEYYGTHAPDTLKHSTEKKFLPLQQFSVSPLTLPVSRNLLLTTIRYDPDNRNIFIRTREGKLFELTLALMVKDSFPLSGPPSDVLFTSGEEPIVSFGCSLHTIIRVNGDLRNASLALLRGNNYQAVCSP